MKKNKLVMALLVCTMAVMPAYAAEHIVNSGTYDVTTDMNGYSGTNGGAVYNESTGTLTVSDGVTFSENSATNQWYGGGAIYNSGGQVNIGNNVTFENNYLNQPNPDFEDSANYSAGGAIASWNSGNVTIGTNAKFNNNGYNSDSSIKEGSTGGAIYSDTNWGSQATLTIGDNAEFTDNRASMAGALYLGSTKAEIGSATYSGNETTYGNGGAIYSWGYIDSETGIDTSSNVTLGTSNFENNTSAYKGGAIYNCQDSTFSIGENSSFEQNSAAAMGGAIYNDARMEIKDGATFIGNSAEGNGGAIFNTTEYSSSSEITIASGAEFINNTSNENGGAIYNAANVEISGATFTGNSAQTGGAVYNTQNAQLSLTNTTFNTADSNGENDIYNAGSISTSGENIFSSAITNTSTGTIAFDGTNTINGELTNSGALTFSGSATISETGKISNQTGGTISGVFSNYGTVEGVGTTELYDGSSNSGTIEDNIIKSVKKSDSDYTGSFTNDGTITAKENFINNGTITKTSNSETTAVINVKSGQNDGTILQDQLNITDGTFTNNGALGSGDFKIDINNNGTLINTKTDTITAAINAGTITNNENKTITNNSSIIAETIYNKTGALITGDTGSLTVNNEGSNAGTITQNDITIGSDSSFENTGTITAKGTFTNNGEFTGEGSLISDVIANNGTLSQKDITITGTSTNNSSITSTGNFSSSGEITGTGSIMVQNGSITAALKQNQFTVSDKGTFTVDNTTLTAGEITNNGTIELQNTSALVANSQANALSGVITSIGNDNSMSITKEDGSNADFSGTLNIGDTNFDLNSGNIVSDAIVNVTSNGTLNINNSSAVNLNQNDTWTGKVTLNDTSSLTVNGRTDNGAIAANNGTLTIETGTLQIREGSSIADSVAVTIDKSAAMNIQGGEVVLNNNDNWSGTISLGTEGLENDSSLLDISGLDSTGTLLANNGTLQLGSNNLDIQGDSYIKEAVALETSGNINISNGGRVAIDDNDTLNGTTLNLLEDGTLDYGKTQEDTSAIIIAEAGNLNLLSNSNLTLNSGSSIADKVALDIQKDANLKLENIELNLDNQDKWEGNIINEGGTINTTGVVNSANSSATLIQSAGETNIKDSSDITLGGAVSAITGGEINITNGSVLKTNGNIIKADDTGDAGTIMTIDSTSQYVVGSGVFALDTLNASAITNSDGSIQAALVNTMNGERNTSTIGTINVSNQVNFNIDVHARSNINTSNDQFIVGSVTGDGTVMVDKWGLNGDIYGWDAPIDRHITLGNIFMDEDGNPLEGNIEITQDTTFTPIGWYQLNKNTGANGINYTLDMVKWNPQVFRGQVTTVAQWMNQLNIDDMLFTHSMVLPSFKDEDGGVSQSMMANRYAAESPLFAPYQYSRKDGGLWYKAYGTFENLQMNNGLSRVGNNAYGVLVGADFGLKELKNGWKFMPTAYLGYNGAHQTFAKVGAYQNGGQLGFLGTWYKDNFIIGALAYGGIYDNSMDVFGHTDNTFNYFGGAATKAAYNIRLHRDLVLQPNLFVSYNYFGQQNWHSNFGQMGMMAGDLNGVNIAPGVNLIWEKETFSAYATLQYMYNINGAVGGRAGNVGLPQMEMERGYIQYGLGFTKKFTDRASGYFQTVFRNVGRTGVGFQLGFNFMLGK